MDHNLTGSTGKIVVSLKDDGYGGLYRSDAKTPHAKWSIVGNLFYDEGIAIVKTPHLFYYGKNKTEINFKGDFNVHSLVLNIPVKANEINLSQNSGFVSLPPTSNVNDSHLEAINISTVNIHDENMNIIMKANLAQPIIKTSEDEFVIRLKKDF